MTHSPLSLKNLPTTWGLRRLFLATSTFLNVSEKPPHHMGIKTSMLVHQELM